MKRRSVKMRGKPLYPFIVTAILGVGLITILSFVGLYQGSQGNESAKNDENSEEQEFDNPIELGEHIFLQNCASCHGDNLEGNGNPPLNALEGRYTADEIVEIIGEGPGIMPAGLATGEEAEAVAQYLLSESE